MKRVAWIRVRVFLKPDDAHLEDSLRRILAEAIPLTGREAYRQGIRLERTVKEGFEGKKIIVLTLTVSKEKPALRLLSRLIARLAPGEMSRLLRHAHEYVDEHGRLYLRLDLHGYVLGRALLVHHGHCVHTTIQFLAYPKTREGILSVARSLLEAMTPPILDG